MNAKNIAIGNSAITAVTATFVLRSKADNSTGESNSDTI
jgi:hypothetical protein